MTILTLMRRDLAEYRTFFPVALLLGLLALASPLIPGLGGERLAEIRTAVAGTVGGLLGIAMALLHGGILSRDLAQGRLTFWLSKPVSPLALVAGRLGAGLLLALGLAVATLLPSLLRHPGEIPLVFEMLGYAALAYMAALGMGHAWHTTLRNRTLLVLGDAAILVATALGAWGVHRELHAYGVTAGSTTTLLAFGGAYGAAGLLGAFIQATVGHADARRGHRALTLTMAAGMTLALAVGGGMAWRLGPGQPFPSAAEHSAITQAHGEWAVLHDWGHVAWIGGRQGYASGLLHLPTGTYHALPFGEVVLSEDGRRAAWTRPEPGLLGPGTLRMQVADLGRGTLHLRTIQAPELGPLPLWWKNAFMSPGGHRFAILSEHALHILDLDAGLLEKSHPIPTFDSGDLRFEGEDHLRFLGQARTSRQLFSGELDLPRQRLGLHPCPDASSMGWIRGWHPETRRALISEADRKLLVDTRDGRVLRAFGKTESLGLRLQPDGGLVGLETQAGAVTVVVRDPMGEPLRRIPIPTAVSASEHPSSIPCPSLDRLLVRIQRRGGKKADFWLVNPRSGGCMQVPEHHNMIPSPFWDASTGGPFWQDASGRLLRGDPTGTLTPIPGVQFRPRS